MISQETGEIFTVSELNRLTKNLLENEIGSIWVQGEISNFARPSSGHWYFSLKDSNAQVRCAMFMGKNRSLNFTPENGMAILAKAAASLYEGRGEFQLIVDYLELIGDGALQKQFELLSRKLSAEGLFENIHKKALPSSVRCIGVITSPTGAAIRDILHILQRRAPHIPVIIYPTQVQGALAAPQIVSAIQTANQRHECDVLILARGGGSLEDLWPFNEEIVARAIFASDIPIVSGVGHEVDFTISDWVADYRAPTPSAAAEIVSPNTIEWQSLVQKSEYKLKQALSQMIQQRQNLLHQLQKRLRHPKVYLQQLAQQLDYLELRLQQLIQTKIQFHKQKLAFMSQTLNALSPLQTLERGFSIAQKNDHTIIQSVHDLKINETFMLRVKDGKINCKKIENSHD